MLCLVSLLHHKMVEGQMSVWRQMALLYMVEYLQKTVFWALNSQTEDQMTLQGHDQYLPTIYRYYYLITMNFIKRD